MPLGVPEDGTRESRSKRRTRARWEEEGGMRSSASGARKERRDPEGVHTLILGEAVEADLE